ncbi:uncharacterized protein VP01_8521g1 [Puccinia sorghi]|uniref:Tet-like 2OG-Fe(II) oxygenase domain-containing protein n=1 Tax=Puccinia sorghi TaxID=27349 RepID=A0A0L6U9U3_9BASI|nr:uncharacterized protein VP01_8521g1 [Puccinia sorghi]
MAPVSLPLNANQLSSKSSSFLSAPCHPRNSITGNNYFSSSWDGLSFSSQGEWFGRCSMAHLSALIKLFQYNTEDKAASFQEANKWIETHIEKLAPGVLQKYRQLLLKSELPSFAQIEYLSPYDPLDFASFFMFTMYNFHNEDHMDKDANTWTLVFWIPIFNPLTSTETDPILADNGFDMIGGFSCQMSEKMSNAVVAYINTIKKACKISGVQKVQIENAEAKLAKKNKLKLFFFSLLF